MTCKKKRKPKNLTLRRVGCRGCISNFFAPEQKQKKGDKQKMNKTKKDGSDKNKTKISLQFFWGYNQAKSLSVFDKFLRSSSSYNVAVLAKLSNP